MPHVAEEGVLPDKGLSKGSVGYQRDSIAKNMAVSDRGGAEFLTAVENTRAIKVLPGHRMSLSSSCAAALAWPDAWNVADWWCWSLGGSRNPVLQWPLLHVSRPFAQSCRLACWAHV